MIKVKDGYGKLIGTTYQGSATQVLLSNGGNLEFSSGTKANTLVQRNANQHVYATYFNSAISDEALTDIGSVYVRNTSDTFIRRISKTQFYSIIDNKFVTLDTAQTITGVKTFSTGPILAINAIITQNQNSTSNYTTVIKWLKGGTSQGTYNPSIGQHNTGGDGTGSICILPYPTETSPWNGTVGLFISKGVLRLDGRAVAIAENYYTKTESDNRYVNVTGDTMTGPLIVKASITGTQLISNIANGTAPLKVTSETVVTNLNSDLLDGYHETSFFRTRGKQTIASSIPTTTELSSNNNLSGNWNVTFPGASGHLVQFNTGSGSTRYMQFYSHYSGSLYWRNSTDSTLSTKSWKTIVDSANYTGIVLKIGTATKGSATLPIYLNAGTPTACSTTLGVSITGNANTATNADKLDGQHASAFSYKSWWHWSGQSGQPTWIWGGNSENNYYVYNPSNFSVNYATYSGSLSNNTSTNANTLYRNPGFTAWSVWSTFSNTPTNSYTNGINLNSSDANYGWQLAKPAFVDRPYYRGRQAGSFTSWKGIAFTSDIPTVTNYYWANVRVSSSSSTSTSPTFSTAYTSNWFRSNGQTGWYSQTYGGGIYMTDSSYVRVYGSKRFYAASGYLSPYGGGSWISMATRTNCIVADQNNSASSAHALFRVKNSSGHAIAFGGLGANIGFYGFYASRISSGANGTDWSTVWNVETGVITHSKTIYTAGYYHSSVNSNNYVLLAGGSYKNLADFAKGNAGSSTQGVYVTGGTVKAMTYKLNATVNSGSSGKLAYYSGTNSIDGYTSTKGSSSTPIYLNAGVPTACSGVIVKYWGWYNISCYSSTTPTYSKKGGNFNFVTSVSRRSEGKYTVGTVYPSGYTHNNTIYWGSGRLNEAKSSNSSNSLLYVTMFNGYQSGSTYYLYVNTADDSSANDGSFDVFFLCF